MAFAPHGNDKVLAEMQMGQIPSPSPLVLGCFTHKDSETLFEFGERRWADDNFAPEFPHIIFLNHGARLAKVFKSVAYVVVNEDENGPVVEKWPIKKFREYDTSWVRI